MPNALSKSSSLIPSLPKGNNKAVAEKLHALIAEAHEGLVRIATLGAFIDHIKAELPRGQFNAWIAEHCPEVTRSSVHNWRKICAGLLNDAGLSGRKLRALERPLHEVLQLKFEDLTEPEQSVVSKIRNAAHNTTHSELKKRPKAKAKALSPVESVNAKNLAAFKHWSLMVGEIDLALNGDSLNHAIHHDPALSSRIEEVRIRLGDVLKEVVRAHKREASTR